MLERDSFWRCLWLYSILENQIRNLYAFYSLFICCLLSFQIKWLNYHIFIEINSNIFWKVTEYIISPLVSLWDLNTNCLTKKDYLHYNTRFNKKLQTKYLIFVYFSYFCLTSFSSFWHKKISQHLIHQFIGGPCTFEPINLASAAITTIFLVSR